MKRSSKHYQIRVYSVILLRRFTKDQLQAKSMSLRLIGYSALYHGTPHGVRWRQLRMKRRGWLGQRGTTSGLGVWPWRRPGFVARIAAGLTTTLLKISSSDWKLGLRSVVRTTATSTWLPPHTVSSDHGLQRFRLPASLPSHESRGKPDDS